MVSECFLQIFRYNQSCFLRIRCRRIPGRTGYLAPLSYRRSLLPSRFSSTAMMRVRQSVRAR